MSNLSHVRMATAAGHVVDLVGTVHLGTEGYWSRVRDIVAARLYEGSVLHLEGIGGLGDESSAGPVRRRRFASLAGISALASLSSRTDVPGMVGPRAGLGSEIVAVAENHDLNLSQMLDLQRVFSPTALVDTSALMRWLLARDGVGAGLAAAVTEMEDEPNAGEFALRPLRLKLRNRAMLGFFGLSARVVVDERNAHAIAQAIAEPRPVVLVWGLGHLPGMVTELERCGYWRIAVEPVRA